jgi:chemotaxis protein MotB
MMRLTCTCLVVVSLALGCAAAPPRGADSSPILSTCEDKFAFTVAERDICLSEVAELRSEQQARSGVREDLSACLAEGAECEKAVQQHATDAKQWVERHAQLEREVEDWRQRAEAAEQREMESRRRAAELAASLEEAVRNSPVAVVRSGGRVALRLEDRILFASGSADLIPQGAAALDKVAEALAGSPDRIRVEGHTDDLPIRRRSKDLYFSNWELSAARAASVVRYLQFHHHFDPARMEVVGMSAYTPIAANDDAEGRERNRRVEIVLLPPPAENEGSRTAQFSPRAGSDPCAR